MITKIQSRKSEYPRFTIKDNIIHEGLQFIKDLIEDYNISYNIKYLQEGYSDTKCDYFNDWKTDRSRIMRRMRDLFDKDNEVLVNIMLLESNYEKDSEEYKTIINNFSEMKFELISAYDNINDFYVDILVFLNEPGKKLLERIKEKNSTSEDALLREEIERVTCEKMGIDYDDYHED